MWLIKIFVYILIKGFLQNHHRYSSEICTSTLSYSNTIVKPYKAFKSWRWRWRISISLQDFRINLTLPRLSKTDVSHWGIVSLRVPEGAYRWLLYCCCCCQVLINMFRLFVYLCVYIFATRVSYVMLSPKQARTPGISIALLGGMRIMFGVCGRLRQVRFVPLDLALLNGVSGKQSIREGSQIRWTGAVWGVLMRPRGAVFGDT